MPPLPTSTTSYKLSSPHSDGISSLCFHHTKPNILLSTSWDKSMKLYNVLTNEMVCEEHDDGALLCGALNAHSPIAYGAGLSGSILKYEYTMQRAERLGTKHDKAIKCIKFMPQRQILCTGSWDKTCALFDARQEHTLVQKLQCPERVYTMDVTPDENYLVVGHAHRIICIWDLRKMSERLAQQLSKRESNIEHQIRVIACGNDSETFAIGASEGRVSMNWIDMEQNNQKQYAFRCHRSREDNKELLFPVNSIAFHPVHGTFMTGGCDGKVQLWDGFQKKKLPVSYSYPSSIADVKFNCDGSIMAVASSYTYEQGARESSQQEGDDIFIERIDENAMKPLA